MIVYWGPNAILVIKASILNLAVWMRRVLAMVAVSTQKHVIGTKQYRVSKQHTFRPGVNTIKLSLTMTTTRATMILCHSSS